MGILEVAISVSVTSAKMHRLPFRLYPPLSDSGHLQYSDWMVAVVRCDETEERDDDHWAGGCDFLEYGGYTWHLR